jgi:hypothetical protein
LYVVELSLLVVSRAERRGVLEASASGC